MNEDEERIIANLEQWDAWVVHCRKHSRHFDPKQPELPCVVLFSEAETGWENPYIEYVVLTKARLQEMLARLS